MDDAGWRARRAARKEQEAQPQRDQDGQYMPYEQQAQPMQEDFIGGFHLGLQPPPPPPKDRQSRIPGLSALEHATDFLRSGNDEHQRPWAPSYPSYAPTTPAASVPDFTHMTAVERSNMQKTARFKPHIQFMCGPLLRFDNIVDNRRVWKGFVMIVTADAGSIYEPAPSIKYQYDPDAAVDHTSKKDPNGSARGRRPSLQTYELAAHPADLSTTMTAGASSSYVASPRSVNRKSEGQEIWVYEGSGKTYTFWRFALSVDLAENEMVVAYSVNNGPAIEFWVPGQNQNMRWAAHSCNGFSAGINPDTFRGPGFQSGYDPVWMDLLYRHGEQPYHALVGGGDQLYCDAITREPELQAWVTSVDYEAKAKMPATHVIALAIDRFYFNHYCKHFRSGAFARANCSIPMMNMLDDHDLIDGFGSYPDALQNSPIFSLIGSRAYHYFLLFQCFICPRVDGLDDQHHPISSLITGGPGPYIPYPSHSTLSDMGPDQWMLMLDCRAERTKMQVCSPEEYDRVMARLETIPSRVKHLIVQLGIPIAYPRLVFLEKMLGSNLNPLVALGKAGKAAGFKGFFNKFNQDAELLDDLNDHWTAESHKKERNWFIQELQNYALRKRIRITFVSGDVHCGAVGVLKTLSTGKGKTEIPPDQDYRFMLNVVTSAIVNTPPPVGVLTMVGSLATKVHKTMHYCDTDETMLPLFDRNEVGETVKPKYIIGKRNWTSVVYDRSSDDLVFDIRVEFERGAGATTGFVVRAPPPRWQ